MSVDDDQRMRLFDAHNHMQDERFGGGQDDLFSATRREGVVAMVVNGSCESDWPKVLALAQKFPEVIPSFGYHPWYLHERTPAWREALVEFLDRVPSPIGEVGLDRWKPGLDVANQEEVFCWQLELAAARELPLSIHCLQAWGRLHDLLRAGPRPACGFLLHSYGGPREMIQPLARLGAYFSLPGYFAHERKSRQRETFRHVPADRLLIETDAPDQALPGARSRHSWADPATGRPLNHPANLGAIYEFAAEITGRPLESLAGEVEDNFRRLFGRFWGIKCQREWPMSLRARNGDGSAARAAWNGGSAEDQNWCFTQWHSAPKGAGAVFLRLTDICKAE